MKHWEITIEYESGIDYQNDIFKYESTEKNKELAIAIAAKELIIQRPGLSNLKRIRYTEVNCIYIGDLDE